MGQKKTRSFIRHEVCSPKGLVSQRGSFFSRKKFSSGPQSHWSFPVSGVDEEHFTHIIKAFVVSQVVWAKCMQIGENEPSPEVFQITQFLKQLADSLFPLKSRCTLHFLHHLKHVFTHFRFSIISRDKYYALIVEFSGIKSNTRVCNILML